MTVTKRIGGVAYVLGAVLVLLVLGAALGVGILFGMAL